MAVIALDIGRHTRHDGGRWMGLQETEDREELRGRGDVDGG